MPEKERLGIDERFRVIRIHRERYLGSSKKEKGEILDHLEETLQVHRKSLCRLLRGSGQRRKRRVQRGRHYGADVDDALRVISEAHNHVCAERLQPNLVAMAQQLAAHGELRLTESLLDKLGRISVSTVRRHLDRINQDKPRRSRRTPGTSSHARSLIPTSHIPWSESVPGHFEVDLVHHCGAQTRGEYVYTLQMVDVATGWTESAALLGRSARVMVDAFTRCERRIPFPVREVHSDNGSEFFVWPVLRHWRTRANVPRLSRSRPYRKNDNRFVEQRNGDLVRRWIGDVRLDTALQTNRLNEIYDLIWRYFNLCQPVMRLAEKTRSGSGTVRRRYDVARTPLQRLKATQLLPQETVSELDAIYAATNPRELRRQILAATTALSRLPGARQGQSEDIFATLLPPRGKEDGIR